MKEYAIIVAGGIGSRMGADIPKQFLLINDEPIIVRTIKQFLSYNEKIEIVLVLPKDHVEVWNELQVKFFLEEQIKVTEGGSTRTASVLAGLKLVNEGLVAIHDAVRPYVSKQIIGDSFESARQKGSGVATVAMKDSLRELDSSKNSIARDRENYVLVQTPQTFNVAKLKEAYAKLGDKSFSDDATVFENAGFKVHLIEGSYSNIKITTPDDLK